MATFDDVTRITAELADVTIGVRYGTGTWKVGSSVFAWERPLSKADVKRLNGAAPPSGPILAVSVADLGDKQAVLAMDRPGVFTIAHFDEYPAVLIQLDTVSPDVLRELLVDAWMTAAPSQMVEEYLSRNPLL